VGVWFGCGGILIDIRVGRDGDFTGGLLTFVLVSGLQLTQHNRGKCHFFSATFPSQLETMVGGTWGH
jgi:hypothetical protein